MQVQIQALIAGRAVARKGEAMKRSNIEFNIEMAKLLVFNGEAGNVGEFIIACRLYLRIKIRETTVKEQIQWVLSYI